MRLLNSSTLEITEFSDTDVRDYAILSHTWGKDEVTFEDIENQEPSARCKKGYAKLLEASKSGWASLGLGGYLLYQQTIPNRTFGGHYIYVRMVSRL